MTTSKRNVSLLTDRIERELSQQAISARYDYPLDRAIRLMFLGLTDIFRKSDVNKTHSLTHTTAH